MFTTVKVRTGEFDCYWNGERTEYYIFNRSVGMNGKGNNVYGIMNRDTGKQTIIGSLQKAKKMVEFTKKVMDILGDAYDYEISSIENMFNNGYDIIYDRGNWKFHN